MGDGLGLGGAVVGGGVVGGGVVGGGGGGGGFPHHHGSGLPWCSPCPCHSKPQPQLQIHRQGTHHAGTGRYGGRTGKV
ncbi:hypothetical protein OG552_10105 [Streptomyces sp. NBC_01476]|uniref:hypothetical protein n=1 Tax=Streptomyces sp. NBC_01476 TaxID=2903881 RepID=UPI002E37FAD9|nr:hypothetical protein [Streptomyces sp. NBC_01476]